MAKVRLVSNLDDFRRFTWPTKFECVPRTGESVRAAPYTRRGGQLSRMELKVYQVIHCVDGSVEVELNLKPPLQTWEWWRMMQPE